MRDENFYKQCKLFPSARIDYCEEYNKKGCPMSCSYAKERKETDSKVNLEVALNE